MLYGRVVMHIAYTPIRRVFRDGRAEDVVDAVAVELPVEIYVNGVREAVLETSPGMLEELGMGYARVRGLAVEGVKVNGGRIDLRANPLRTIGPGVPIVGFAVGIEGVFRAVENVFSLAKLFRETGCFHVAALTSVDGGVVELVEDISRHCALYKLIGRISKIGMDASNKLVVMSSRAASHLVEAVALLTAPVAVFRGAPTGRAIERARELNLTLVAHTGRDKFNIYTHGYRIRL